ncbi:hypothetical protein [Nannocystis pusilla]|uniref:hypothetical protein n=1 Tax=Nannocystis pusilla TaxID=889268 RepID=UPI003B8050AB
MGQILSGVHVESQFDLGFTASSKHGITFTGSSALEIKLPLHLALGPVELNALTFSVGVKGNQSRPASAPTSRPRSGRSRRSSRTSV